MKISFTVLGKPQGKARPRFSKNGRKPYTPKGTSEYEELVRASYLRVYRNVKLSGDITAEITAYFLVPKRVSKSKRTDMLSGRINPTVKPDADNIIKAVLDALNGYAYKDDSAVVKVTAIKKYAEYPYVEITLTDNTETEE